MIMEGVVVLICGILVYAIWKEWQTLKVKGNLLYTFKNHGRGLYTLAIVYLLMAILYNLEYIGDMDNRPLWLVVAWDMVFFITLWRCLRKYGIYENLVVAKRGYYKSKDVINFHWAHYVVKSQVEALILEVPKGYIFKRKTITTIEIEIPIEDVAEVEAILKSYGIEEKKIGNNTLNVEV